MRRWFHSAGRWGAGLALVLATLVLGSSYAQAEPATTGGFLGVYTRDLDAAMLEALNFDGDGILIDDVVKDSPAEKAGLKAGDIITQVNDRKMISTRSLKRALWRVDPGETAVVHVWRNGKESEYKIAVAEKPEKRLFTHTEGPWMENDGGTVVWHSKGKRAFLGVSVQSLTDQLAGYFGVNPDEGALIGKVVEDSPAEKAGLKAGDVILKVGDEEIHDTGDVTDAVRSQKPGDEVEVEVMRDRKKKTFKATLAEKEDTSWNFNPGAVGYIVHDALEDLPDLRIEMKQLKSDLRDLKVRVDELAD